MPSNRVFSEQEATKIIQRAVELTEQSSSQSYKAGVTREELERIAAEVGVSADALARAISEAGQSPKTERSLFGLTQEFERVVEGELDPSQYDVVIEGLKPLANAGQPAAAQVGRTLSMSAWTGVGQAKIDLTSRNGRTRVKVRSNPLFQFLMTIHPALIGSLIALGSLGEKGLIWVGAAVAAGLLTIGGSLFAMLTRRGHVKAEKLADELRERIANTLSETESEGSETAKAEEPLVQRLGQGS
jgi:hypothetical protein